MMNRKQKIIVSITGIILVSLILIGLTYAYFLTKITGNTNEKSISVSTANLVLEYGENTNVVQGINNAEPGYSVEKIFTATNKGNSTVTYGAALESIVNELTRQEDLVYTLTCTSYLKEGFSLANDGTITGTVDGTCNGVSTEKQFPSTSTLSVMVTNTIDTTHTQAYKLTITYKEMNVDQSDDMNKTFSAKVNIVDINALTVNNPYKNDTGTLKKAIIDNAMLGVGTTVYREVPLTNPGNEIATYKTGNMIDGEEVVNMNNSDCSPYSWSIGNTPEEAQKASVDYTKTAQDAVGKYVYCPDKWTKKLLAFDSSTHDLTFYKSVEETKTEQTLSKIEDNDGISYYYRGNVDDNYIDYAGMCWRIVRIEGDGSIKIILENKNNVCEKTNGELDSKLGTANWGIDNTNGLYKANYLNPSSSADSALVNLFKTFQTDSLKDNLTNLKSGNWCMNEKAYASGTTTLSTTIDKQNYYTNKTAFDYETKVRLENMATKSPTLKCNGTVMTKYSDNSTDMYVGTLTADEVVFAGEVADPDWEYGYNDNFYLSKDYNWWTLSLGQFDSGSERAYTFTIRGLTNYITVGMSIAAQARPAVQLKNTVTISKGDGTINNPYVVQ